jgi:lactoylglutathione lyase
MKLSRLLFAAILSTGVTQATSAQTAAKPIPAVLNHIAIYVADLKAATDFYHEMFDLELMPEPFKDGRHSWFSLGPGGALHIISGAKVRSNYQIDEHLCFSMPSIETFIQKLKTRKIVYMNFNKAIGEVTLRTDGVHQIYFQDPDGHWLEVNDAKN